MEEASGHHIACGIPCGHDPLGLVPVEDWEAVDGSPDSTEKALQATSSHLPSKAARTAAGNMGQIFLTTLQVNMGNAALVCNVQSHLEELEQHILALEQEAGGPEEVSISDSKAVSDGDVNAMRPRIPAWQRGLLCSRR